MERQTALRGWLGTLAIGAGFLLPHVAATAGEPALKGYTDYHAYRLQLESIGSSPWAKLESLGRTRGQREVYLLKISTGRADRKPAILIVGNVDPPQLVGSELAVRLARRLVEGAEADKALRKLLDRVSFYVIPRPAPDACEAFFRRPYVERTRNEQPIDDDRDGAVDEDGPEDLNGDGWITMMRVADPTGAYMPHPDDDRVLIEADPKKGEQGRYALHIEGRDNDQDEQQGEDPPGGVALNRNFTFRYPYFATGAGPHQVSEVETRAVADFAFSHPNIAAVLCFAPEDNLMRPWESDESSESERIKTAVLSDDAPYFEFVGEQYEEIHEGEGPPESQPGEGALSEWAYFHYGRWSFACRGWWIPKVPPDEDEQEESDPENKAAEEESSHEEPEEDAEPEEDERGQRDLNALQWFAREKIDAFVDWKRIDHADFPGKRVEVGGFKPFWRLNPPADQLKPLAEKHWRFLCRLTELLPRVVIHEAKAEPLGGGVWRVTAVVVNRGYLPSMSKMGQTTRQPHPLQVALELPDNVSLVTGYARVQLPPLAGHGGKAKQTWLVAAPQTAPTSLRLRVWSPSVGAAQRKIQLVAPPSGEQQKTKGETP